MKKTRNLKYAEFTYSLVDRDFLVSKITEDETGGAKETIRLTKAEACAFSRFIFSMIQYHPNKPKK
jgi:hypothetical protein